MQSFPTRFPRNIVWGFARTSRIINKNLEEISRKSKCFWKESKIFLSANWQYRSNLRGIRRASVFCFSFRKEGGFLGEGKIILEDLP
jgi:hypothetical protein